MMNQKVQKSSQTYKSLNYILGVSIFLLFLGMVVGGINRAWAYRAWLGGLHQILVGVGGLLLSYSFIAGLRLQTWNRIGKITGWVSSAAFLIQVVIGQLLSKDPSSELMITLHFLTSVIILVGGTATAAIQAISSRENPAKLRFYNRFHKLSLALVGLVFVVIISGSLLKNFAAEVSCSGWPICLPENGGPIITIPMLHRIGVGVIGAFTIWFISLAWGRYRASQRVLPLANLFGFVYLGQIFIGAMQLFPDIPSYFQVLHTFSAVFLLLAGTLLVIFLGIELPDEKAVKPTPLEEKIQRKKDFIAINKPIVVSLLLATTLAGMVMGAKGFPPFWKVAVTLLAGGLAAGGAGAVNQYLDRDLDRVMARTAGRPIPSGRLAPAEGLSYGIAAMVTSFYLLAGLINLQAALLALAGMIYYIWFYSILLKRRTDQNIVIGGGAGAIPPLVGWAAATGSLNLTAAFLFLIIFLWTPPHFWALALTRSEEYATAGVPMMPVQRGEAATSKMIFGYTIVLVACSMLIAVLGMVGWIYLTGAVPLGLYLVYLAWQVRQKGRNRTYYRMYRHSNYYLLFLFVFLAIDSVLI